MFPIFLADFMVLTNDPLWPTYIMIMIFIILKEIIGANLKYELEQLYDCFFPKSPNISKQSGPKQKKQ